MSENSLVKYKVGDRIRKIGSTDGKVFTITFLDGELDADMSEWELNPDQTPDPTMADLVRKYKEDRAKIESSKTDS